MQQLRALLPSDRCAQRKHVVAQESHNPERDVPGEPGVNWKGYVSRFFPSDPGFVAARNIDCYVSTRVSHSHNQHATLLKLTRILVALRMQLKSSGTEIMSKCRNAGNLVIRHRYDHIFRFVL